MLSGKSLHVNKLYKTTSRDKLLLPFYRWTTSLSLSCSLSSFSSLPPSSNFILYILKQYRELSSGKGMLPCVFSAIYINVLLNRRDVWLNPDHRCPRTPNTQTTTLSLMAKELYKNLKKNRNDRDFSYIPPFCTCSVFIRILTSIGASHIYLPVNINKETSTKKRRITFWKKSSSCSLRFVSDRLKINIRRKKISDQSVLWVMGVKQISSTK